MGVDVSIEVANEQNFSNFYAIQALLGRLLTKIDFNGSMGKIIRTTRTETDLV